MKNVSAWIHKYKQCIQQGVTQHTVDQGSNIKLQVRKKALIFCGYIQYPNKIFNKSKVVKQTSVLCS